MPDVWTTNPPVLREALVEAGAECGVEARVLKPRDTYWTCHVDSNGWLRDIYIHPVTELSRSVPYFYSPIVVALGVGVFVGLVWGKRFWR